jgi:serine/threonine-protein kinase RsbW/sigma-B regulation protein RsbU (phosphoserine phosphatase)
VSLPEAPDSERRAFLARLRMLHDALDFVAAFAALKSLSERDLLRLQLVIEELFTNSIEHGYGKECDEPIEIALAAAPGHVTVEYQDAAEPYDPARALATSRERVSEPPEQRPVGHLGVHLVAAIVDDMHYARVDGRNRLQILMRVAG